MTNKNAHEKEQDFFWITIADLLGKYLNPEEKNSWRLPPYQRAFEWNSVRIVNLVDSVLQGFDIGTILIAKKTGKYYEPSIDTKLRDLKNKKEHDEIIDGQQRCLSILATFGGQGWINPETGRKEYLWVNVNGENPCKKDFDIRKWQEYQYAWGLENEQLRHFQKRKPITDGNGWEKVTLAELQNENLKTSQVGKDEQSLRERIGCAIRKYRIAVRRMKYMGEAKKESQLFIKINAGGKPLNGLEIFFAGVKTLWTDAEAKIKIVYDGQNEEDAIFPRRAVITLLARCAAKSLQKPFDPVNLKLEHLNYQSKTNQHNGTEYPLLERMKKLIEEQRFINAIRSADEFVKKNFYYAAWYLPFYVTMPLVAWLYQRAQGMTANDLKNLVEDPTNKKNIRQFIFWATVIRDERSRQTTFQRDTFDLAWMLGKEKKSFPSWGEKVNEQNKKNLWEICFSTLRIRPGKALSESEDRFPLMNKSKLLFLSIFQEFDQEFDKNPRGTIDLDHIFPYKWAPIKELRQSKQSKNNDENKKKIMNLINEIGNFAAIDGTANKEFQANSPEKKLQNNKGKNYSNRKYIKTDPKVVLEPECIIKKIEGGIDAALKGGGQKELQTAAEYLAKFVRPRTERIWKEVVNIIGDPPHVTRKPDGVSAGEAACLK